MAKDMYDEAFKHLERQVAKGPQLAYAQFARFLFLRLKRKVPTDVKEFQRAADDVKRFYEVHRQIRETLPPGLRDDTQEGIQYGEFIDWEEAQPRGPPHVHNRVEFVPRVAETPFGVPDDFEKQWLE